MVSVDELKYFGDPQGNFKILKPWWDVFTEYLTVIMLMIAVFGATLQMSSATRIICVPIPHGVNLDKIETDREELKKLYLNYTQPRIILDRQQYNLADQWCYDTATLWYSKYFPYMVLLHSLIFLACSNFWFKFPGTSSKIEHFTAVLVKCIDSPWTTKALSETVYEHLEFGRAASVVAGKQPAAAATDLPRVSVVSTTLEKTAKTASLVRLPQDTLSLSKSTSKIQGPAGVIGHHSLNLLDKKEGEQAKALFEKVKKFRLHTEDGDILYKMYLRQTLLRFTHGIIIAGYVSVLTPLMSYIIHCKEDMFVTGFGDYMCLHGLLRMFTMLSYAYLATMVLYSLVCLYTLYWIVFYKLKDYSFQDVREETDVTDIPDVKNDFAFLLHLIDQYDSLYSRKFAIFLSDVSENRLLQINLNYEWTQEKLMHRTTTNANGKIELHLFMLPGIPSALYELQNVEVLKLELIKESTVEPQLANLTLLGELWILNSIVHMDAKAIHFLKETLLILHVRFSNALEIPMWMYNMKKLRELYLDGDLQIDMKNIITFQSFRELESIKIIEIQSNVEKLPVSVIDVANHLQQLTLNNKGTKLLFLNNIKKLTNLGKLRLIQCGLDRIPSAVFSLNELQELDLKDNNLTNINEVASFQNLRKFTSLKLNQNLIDTISPYIGRVTSLQILNLSKNRIADLPSNLFRLTRLWLLDLGYNNISEIPTEISQLQELQHFSVEHNQLQELPLQLFACKKLRVLTLSQNKLTSIPAVIGKLTQLRELRINANKLVMLPPEVGKCILLKKSQFIVEDELFQTLPNNVQEEFLIGEHV